MIEFPCFKCGKCCEKAGEVFKELNRGDGVCIHLDENKLCKVYESRPDICKVDVMYEKHFKELYTWPEYVSANLIICEQLNVE